MDESDRGPARIVSPLRLLIGSLLGGAGLVVLGFFLASGSASAAEPAPPADPSVHSIIGAAISGVDGVASGTASAAERTPELVLKPVRAAVPAPARQLASTLTTPVAAVVDRVAASAPVATAVTPAVTAIDGALNDLPITHGLLGNAPLATAVIPVAGNLDDSLGAVSGVLGGIDATTGAGQPPVTSPPTVASPVDSPATGQMLPCVECSGAPTAVLFGSPVAEVTAHGAGPVVTPSGPAPSAPPIRGADPFGQPATTGNTSSTSGAGPAGLGVALTEDAERPSPASGGVHATPADDRVPVSPVADHDTSPD